MELQYKSIPNPTVTHADKAMNAILDCAKTIKGMTAGNSTSELRDLQQMVDLAKKGCPTEPNCLQSSSKGGRTTSSKGAAHHKGTNAIDDQ